MLKPFSWRSIMRGEERRQTVFTRRSIVVAAAALPLASRSFAKAVQSPATQEDERLMKLAIAEAASGDFPFGCVITRDGYDCGAPLGDWPRGTCDQF
jgi:hypothetical protein